MSSELATVEHAPPAAALPAVRHGRPLINAATLVEEGQQRQLLMKYVQAHMIEDTDFGVIPGTKNRTLLKPGAEKLTDLFRCTPEFEIIERVEDWDRPLIHYVFRCRIVSRETGQVVAEGYGSCNTREAKYRWRNGERTCPDCGKPTIIKGKAEYGGGFLCFAKKGGCGAKFGDQDSAITGQVVGRVENPDVADYANTVLKMAKKRAHVDAAIALARCSDMFTQDAEDFHDAAPPPVVQQTAPKQGKPAQAPPMWEDDEAFFAALTAAGKSWPKVVTWINSSHGGKYAPSAGFYDVSPEHRKIAAAALQTDAKK